MMMPDVNVLVAAFWRNHDAHEDFAQVLTRLADGPEPFALSELVVSAFVRIATTRAVVDPPEDMSRVLEFVDSLIDRPNARLLRPGLEHFSIFLRLLRDGKARGKVVSDAYHAALAIEHGCEWLTADADFLRFPGLRVRHPLRPR